MFDLVSRVKYKAQNSEDQFTTVDSFRNFLTIRNLVPGEAYIVRVQSVRDDVESPPITRVANTSKWLCFISIFFEWAFYILMMYCM